MNIGFDLDGIFVDKPPFIPKSVIEWLYRKHNHRLLYRIPSKPEQFIRKISHHSLLRPVIKSNIQFLKKTKGKSNYSFFLISSRFSFINKETKDILEKNNIKKLFTQTYLNNSNLQPHIFKDNYLKKLKVDRFVDDDLPLLKFLAQRNKNVLFFWLNSKEGKTLDKNLFAIKKFSDVFTKNKR